MEKKIYEKPEIEAVIDLCDEICEEEIFGETRLRIVNDSNERVDGIPVVSENDIDWDDWNLAKKSTIWDDEDED